VLRTRFVPVASIVVAAALAGCGSSSKSSSTAASSAPTTTPSAPAATSPTPSATAAALITTKHAKKLGTILAAGHKKLTVYLLEARLTRARPRAAPARARASGHP
jgi:hypothetical protein